MYQAIPALNLGFQVGMEVGEAHGAFLCATTLVAYKNAIGSPLNEIMQQCESMCKCPTQLDLNIMNLSIGLLFSPCHDLPLADIML